MKNIFLALMLVIGSTGFGNEIIDSGLQDIVERSAKILKLYVKQARYLNIDDQEIDGILKENIDLENKKLSKTSQILINTNEKIDRLKNLILEKDPERLLLIEVQAVHISVTNGLSLYGDGGHVN